MHLAGDTQAAAASLVRPVAVIVPRVLGQPLPQVPLAEDQHVIQALAAQRAAKRSANEFARGNRRAS
jgi:hypothetical protein